jgi:pyruvate dehydrogenase E2 component (dihydrolipoamide acetyltransferase)
MLRRALGRTTGFLLADFTPIPMPALSPSMAEGTLSKWKKKVGDKINSGDTLAMVGTDKAEVSYDHTGDEGYLAKTFVTEGSVVKVGDLICLMCEEEADVKEADSYIPPEPKKSEESAPKKTEEKKAESSPAKADEAPTPKKKETTSSEASQEGSPRDNLKRSGPAANYIGASISDEALAKIKPTGKDGRFTKADLTGAAPSTAKPSKGSEDAKPKASAVARGASPWAVATKPVGVTAFTARDSATIRKVIEKSTW